MRETSIWITNLHRWYCGFRGSSVYFIYTRQNRWMDCLNSDIYSDKWRLAKWQPYAYLKLICMYGYQNTNLELTLAFNIMSSEFVQHLYTGCGVWIAISTISCWLAEVTVYDSMRSALTESLKRRISAILCLWSREKELHNYFY